MTKRDELIEEGQLKYRQMVYKLFGQRVAQNLGHIVHF